MKRLPKLVFSAVIGICILLQTTSLLIAETTKNLTVSTTIPSQASDYQVTLSNSDSAEPFAQNTTLTYTITYGTTISTNTTFTLEAQWYPGTIQGQGSPSVEGLEYVLGSASEGVNNVPAVIDTVNNKITWTFTNFPANTLNQTVTFQLKTNDIYKGDLKVSFPVKARIKGPGVTTSDSTVTRSYLYNPPPTPTPTVAPTATPSITPTPTIHLTSQPTKPITSTPSSPPTITPTPTITTSVPFTLSSVFIETISSDKTTMVIKTNEPSLYTFIYGTSPLQFSETIKGLNYIPNQEIILSELLPHTQYYFKVVAKNNQGLITESDIFTFTTAYPSQAPYVENSSIIVASDDKIVSSPSQKQGNSTPFFLLPVFSTYDLQFSIDEKNPVKKADIVIKNKFVLSATSPSTSSYPSNMVPMIEIRSGVFLAKASTPQTTGSYEVFVRLSDYNGNITEQKIADLIVTKAFTVTDEKGNPIENARILLSVYRNKTKSYEVFGNHSIKDPIYTQYLGKSKLILPPGQYKAEVSALGYTTSEVTFSIGNSPSDGYPHVTLKATPFSLINYTFYLKDTIVEMFYVLTNAINTLASYSRVSDYIMFMLLFMTICTSFLAFSEKTHTHPKASLSQLGYLLHTFIIRSAKNAYIKGVVLDKKQNTSLSKVRIFAIDDDTKNVLFETYSNKKGMFVIKKPKNHFHLMTAHPGFETSILYPNTNDLLYIFLHANTHQNIAKVAIITSMQRILSMVFESFLFLSFILEVFSTNVFGIEKTWPFILFSLFNLLLWMYYLSLKHYKMV